jgi:lipid-binding SYLF domain-containing protein
VGGGGGYGVVVDNTTGHETFMRMANIDLGLGLAIKDIRAVFVFNDRGTMNDFVNRGWEFGAGAEASAKYKESGGSMAQSVSLRPIDIYVITENGVSLSATVASTKYWFDDELN